MCKDLIDRKLIIFYIGVANKMERGESNRGIQSF